MRNVARAVRGLHDRFNVWFQAGQPVTYTDAWRYSFMYGLILGSFTVVYFVLGSPYWSTFLVLTVPTMAAFTFGFAVRQGTNRQRLFSLGVGLVGGGGPLVLPGVRDTILAIGPAGILLVWIVVLIGLFGYAFPDYATAGSVIDRSGDTES